MRARMMLSLVALPAVLVLAGCATTSAVDGRGWSGEGAEPFDGARSACEAEASAAAADARIGAFEACMAGKGWHRR